MIDPGRTRSPTRRPWRVCIAVPYFAAVRAARSSSALRSLRSIACAALAASLASCAASRDTNAPHYELTDLTDDFVAFFDATSALAVDARVAAFKAAMGEQLPGFYDAARIPGTTAEQYDADIARALELFPARREAFAATAASFRSMLRPAIESFAAAFPDWRELGEIVLLHSLGEMDAGTRVVNGRSYLVFGADVMAGLHAAGHERAFFHHELFHVYHERYFAGCDSLWCALWAEGLAVYVAEQLNPGAADAELLLTSPRPIRAEVDGNLVRAVCALRGRLDSTDEAEYAAFFLGGSSFEDLPPRAGYYLGYLALQQAGREAAPRALAHLDRTQARTRLERALDALGACP